MHKPRRKPNNHKTSCVIGLDPVLLGQGAIEIPDVRIIDRFSDLNRCATSGILFTVFASVPYRAIFELLARFVLLCRNRYEADDFCAAVCQFSRSSRILCAEADSDIVEETMKRKTKAGLVAAWLTLSGCGEGDDKPSVDSGTGGTAGVVGQSGGFAGGGSGKGGETTASTSAGGQSGGTAGGTDGNGQGGTTAGTGGSGQGGTTADTGAAGQSGGTGGGTGGDGQGGTTASAGAGGSGGSGQGGATAGNGDGGHSGTIGGAGSSGEGGSSGTGGGGSCWTDDDCAPDEYCVGASICPPDVFCILPSSPGVCTPRVKCSTDKECKEGETCKQVIFPIMPSNGGTGPAKLGECVPASQASKTELPPAKGDQWWYAAEAALRYI